MANQQNVIYTQSYNEGDTLRIEEWTGLMDANIIITLSTGNSHTNPSTSYTVNFPEGTVCDLLVAGKTKYRYLTGQQLNGRYNIKVSDTSSIIKSDNSQTYNDNNQNIPTTPNSITNTSITYNNPNVIIRYKTTKGTITSYIPNGYLKYNAIETKWELEEVHTLYQELLDQQAILAYSDGRKYFDSYEYSYNGLQWFDLKRAQVFTIVVDSSTPAGTLSSLFNSKLFIRLKYTPLDYVYSHHPDFIAAEATLIATDYHPYHTPYEDHTHTFYSGMTSHVLTDVETIINIDSYKINARYYGGSRVNLYLLDFETNPLRDNMINGILYRVFIYLSRTNGAPSQIDYFFIKKIDLNTGEGGGVSGGGCGGLA